MGIPHLLSNTASRKMQWLCTATATRINKKAPTERQLAKVELHGIGKARRCGELRLQVVRTLDPTFRFTAATASRSGGDANSQQ
jgi:hypothetical protein